MTGSRVEENWVRVGETAASCFGQCRGQSRQYCAGQKTNWCLLDRELRKWRAQGFGQRAKWIGGDGSDEKADECDREENPNAMPADEEPPSKRKRIRGLAYDSEDEGHQERPLVRHAPIANNVVFAGSVDCIAERVANIRSYLLNPATNHSRRERRCMSEIVNLVAAIVGATDPNVHEIYSTSKDEAAAWKLHRYGAYGEDGMLSEYATKLSEHLKLNVPLLATAKRDANQGSRLITDIVLREEATSRAWAILEGVTLRMPVCTKQCGVIGSCFTCGALAKLFTDILSDAHFDLMEFPPATVNLLEAAWIALNNRKDLRACPATPESALAQVGHALKTIGDRTFLVSGFGRGMVRLGKKHPYHWCMEFGGQAMHGCYILSNQLCEPCATRNTTTHFGPCGSGRKGEHCHRERPKERIPQRSETALNAFRWGTR